MTNDNLSNFKRDEEESVTSTLFFLCCKTQLWSKQLWQYQNFVPMYCRYYKTQQLSEKSDVFSYGVVLLEIVTGREPLDIKRPRNEWSLVEWVCSMS